MKILSSILILTVLSSAYAQYPGLGNWFDQSFGNYWRGFGDSFRNLGDQIRTTTNNLMWFKGPHVCKKDENRNDPFDEELRDFYEGSGSYNVETCKERNSKYVCISRVSVNGSPKQRMRTYECCPGFELTNNNGKRECTPDKRR